MNAQQPSSVVELCQLDAGSLAALLATYDVRLVLLQPGADIPASYWGAPEAGVIGNRVFARPDTPLHSVLHTACHVIVMPPERRAALHTDCGGTDLEEAAVCYLQALLADALPGYSRDRLFQDMDRWGYSFRLGSARAWFEHDSEDARAFLAGIGLLKTVQAGVGAS